MAFANDPVKHVVVLMLENRSFDHVLGDLRQVDSTRKVEGIDPANLRSNTATGAGTVKQFAGATATLPKKFDPRHEHPNVKRQLGSLANPDMSGFLADAFDELMVKNNFSQKDIEQVMAYFPASKDLSKDPLPALRALARQYTVCDHWFSSLPGPTWPNRFFTTCGTTAGHIRMPESTADIGLLLKAYDMPTIFDTVAAAGRKARIFHDGVSLSMLLRKTWQHPGMFGTMDDFDAACKGPAADFPDFAFIEPKYFALFGNSQNDQHPPHDMANGDQFIARVYNRIRANPALWADTLLVILYDEHGGFYDHVPPPATIAPDAEMGDSENFDFTRLGVRVPALLVSPHVKPEGLDSTVYDHTSLLAYLCRKWDMPHLGARSAQARSFESAIVANANQNNLVALPEVTVRTTRALAPENLPANENQRALALMVDYLHNYAGLSSAGSTTRGLTAPGMAGEPISGDQVARKAAQFLSFLDDAAATRAPAQPAGGRGLGFTAAADKPLKVFMVHGVGHGDGTSRIDWQEQWKESFRQSAAAAGHAAPEKITFKFAEFDALFERYPLDAVTIAKGLLILGRDVFGPDPVFGTRERKQRGLTDTVRWTAGMVVQWIENEALRREFRESLLAQLEAADSDIVCAHSLGAMGCYDIFRRLVAQGNAARLDGRQLITFGTQIAHPAVQSVFGGRIEPLVDAAGHGMGQWFHLYNPQDAVFTRPLPGGDAHTHSLLSPFDIPADPLNHDGAWYLRHNVMGSVVLPALLPAATGTAGGVLRTLAAPALISTSRAQRRALVIGINDYPDPAMQLNGCVNDVYLMSAVLQECGFAADDIRVLTDKRATRAAMLERLDWLSDGVRDGDERVLFYSGHGAQMPVYGANDEPDKMAETLVPVDFDWSAGHAFTDKEFNHFYSHLPYDAAFMAIFDCCHAGGMTRGGQRVRGIDPPDDVRHRSLRWSPSHQMWVPRDFVEVAQNAPRQHTLEAARAARKAGDTKRTAPIVQQRDGIGESNRLRGAGFDQACADFKHFGPYMPMLMFAAGESELAAEYEHGSVSYGAFTFALAKHLRQQRKAPTFERVVTAVRRELVALGYQQTPTIMGPKSRITAEVPILRWRQK